MSQYMSLGRYVDTFNTLGEESRIRLCMLLRERELCVGDLVRVTGMPQPRVSTHLGHLRNAGFVHDRRKGAQSFYTLATDGLPASARGFLDEAAASGDPTLDGDQTRLHELEAERRGARTTDSIERDYSPGRTWQSLARGLAALLDLGDVLDVGSGDGAAASELAPYCRSLTCVDVSERLIGLAKDRLGARPNVTARVADLHELPFADASFDSVLVFHTLTYAARPAQALVQCARVLRPGGRLVLLCLDEHKQFDVTSRFGERHAGFSPRALRALLTKAGLDVVSCDITCRESTKPYLQVVLAVAHKGETHRKSPRKRASRSS